MSQNIISEMISLLVTFATELLFPTMLIMFAVGVVLRILIYYTIKREQWFAEEFEIRMQEYLENPDPKLKSSFFLTTKMLMEKTYYELFVVRAMMMRRRPDLIMAPADRIFLIQNGCARLVKGAIKQLKLLSYDKNGIPDFLKISKNVFQNNPCFSKVFGIFSINVFNDILKLLPGVFIICGIFGTFLGIMKALPDLSGMDVSDVESTKLVMDDFLMRISFSMSTSIVGIIFSVLFNFINALFTPDKVFYKTVNRFEENLETIWRSSENNFIPQNLREFNEEIDPSYVLAEDSVNKEILEKQSRLVDKIMQNKKPQGKKIETSISQEQVVNDNVELPPLNIITKQRG